MSIQTNNEEVRFVDGEFLTEYSFEKIHEMLGELYKGWALNSATNVSRDDRIKMLIFFDELKQYFEKIEEEGN